MGQCVSSSSDDSGGAGTATAGAVAAAAGGNSGNNNNTTTSTHGPDAEPRYCQAPGCQRRVASDPTTTTSTSTSRPSSRYCAQHAALCRRQGCSRPRYRKGPYCQEHLREWQPQGFLNPPPTFKKQRCLTYTFTVQTRVERPAAQTTRPRSSTPGSPTACASSTSPRRRCRRTTTSTTTPRQRRRGRQGRRSREVLAAR